MKVLFLTHYSALYGANRSLIDLFDGLATFGVKPYVVIPEKGPIELQLTKRNIDYCIYPLPAFLVDSKYPIKKKLRWVLGLYRSIHSIYPFIEKWNIDLIYTNSSMTPVGRILAILVRKPHIWHLREFGELHYKKKFIVPKPIAVKLLKGSDVIICNSEALRFYYFGKFSKRQYVVYNGIYFKSTMCKLHNTKLQKEKGKAFTFSIVGTLSQSKGQDTAIEAVNVLIKSGYPVRLVIVGSGHNEYVKFCKELVDKYGINDAVEFAGYIDQTEEIYINSDCLLMCSQNEAMGRVTAEAMAVGIPVIGRNSGGTPEIIKNGQSGLLYNTFSELVDQMQHLIENPLLCEKLGQNGYEIARKSFSIETYATAIYKVLKSQI